MVVQIGSAAAQRAMRKLERQEQRFAKKRLVEQPSTVDRLLEGKVPRFLEKTLYLAFEKAFSLVFTQGGGLIERSCAREALRREAYWTLVATQPEGRLLRRFTGKAKKSGACHVLLAGAEGGILGLLGIGLPDIPLFCGLMLRSLYELCMIYGYSCHTIEERQFMLRLIEVALLRGEAYRAANAALDYALLRGVLVQESEEAQRRRTAAALASHLLYLKFVQGIPLVGIIGGSADAICLHRVLAYAQMKYKRRFLQQGGRLPLGENWTNSQN